MAKQTVFIPGGELCSDTGHLGCMFEAYGQGVPRCLLFHTQLENLEKYHLNGERFRGRIKTAACRQAKTDDAGRGYCIAAPGILVKASEAADGEQ